MAKKITELTELTAYATNDLLIIEDVSAGTTKKITWDNLIDDGSIVTAKLPTSGVTSDKVATDAQVISYVDGLTSGQSTTSASYVDATGITLTFTTPASCTKILLRAEGPCSGALAGTNAFFAITNAANTIQVERIVGISQSNTAHISTFTLSRRITVTASTSYTFKLRFKADGTNAIVINQGSSADRPTCLWVERA